MQSLGQALQAMSTITTPCPSEDYYCPICKRLVPKITIPWPGGQKTVQPRCKCEVEAYEKEVAEAEERKRRSEIEQRFGTESMGERFQTYTFEHFAARTGSERALELAKRYAENFERAEGMGLFIWGEPGNGKSHLAGAVYHEIKARGFMPVFQSVPELLGRIRSTFRRDAKETETEIMRVLLRCDLLILDDIGAEKISDWVLDVMFRIIDGRYRNKKPVLFTTNFAPNELHDRFVTDKDLPEQRIAAKRIMDRILEMSVIVENKATSYRREIAEQRARGLLG